MADKSHDSDKKVGSEYKQGQENNDLREYFYYLDENGQLFLDNTKSKTYLSCYKEQKFLESFFKHLRTNELQRYDEFPFISKFFGDMNYLKCEDLPFVITYLDERNDMVQLNQMNSAHWLFHFDPNRLYMNKLNGRLYYLFEGKEIIRNNSISLNDPKRLRHLDHIPVRIALIKSDLAIYLMKKSQVIKGEKSTDMYSFEYKSNWHRIHSLNDNDATRLLKKFSRQTKDI